MTQRAFSQIVSLIEASRGFIFTPAEREVWFALLAPLDDDDARAGTLQALREVEGRLVPAHIWQRAVRMRYDRRLPALESANLTPEDRERSERARERVMAEVRVLAQQKAVR